MDRSLLLFAAWPYVALAVSGAGLILRHLFSAPIQSDRLAETLRIGGTARLFSGAFLLLLLAHLLAFIAPGVVLGWNRALPRLYLLETAGFGLGMVALTGWFLAMWRHLRRPEPSFLAIVGESMFFALLGVALLSGLVTAVRFRWSSSWAAAIVSPYVASLARGQPMGDLLVKLPAVARLHVLAGFGALALLPATRFGPLLSHVFARALRWAFAPAGRVVEPARAWLARRHFTSWIWRDDEADVVADEDLIAQVTDPESARPETAALLYPAGSSTSSTR